ncbi:MAG: nuclear transport factor 2 family protein [Pseudomonadota bacterium]
MQRIRQFLIVPFCAGLALLALATPCTALAAEGHAVADHAAKPGLAQLEAGVDAEEAVRAVKRLQHTYGHYLEAGMWDDLADLFTDDATGQFGTETVNGKSQLRAHFMQQANRKSAGLAKGQLNAHLILQPIITVSADGKTVKGAWHEAALLGIYGSSATWCGGIYENEYTRINGRWKISRLHFYEQYAGAYDDYGHKAPARWDIPYHFEARHVGVTIPASALQASSSITGKISDAARLSSLATRVQRMDDSTAVENLQHSYGYYLDRKNWDDSADLFADNGTFEVGQRGVYVGREHIRRALEDFYGPAPLRYGELFDHINLATVVTIAPDGMTASARSSQLSQLGLNGRYAQWELGAYENRYVKQDGVWKFQVLRYVPRFNTDYDAGWARDVQPTPGISKTLPPDHKPTQVYAQYPQLQYLGFSYSNPATGKPVRNPGAVVRVAVIKDAPANSKNVVADIAAVQKQLDAAIAVDAVENLNSSYGYYIDESAWDNMSDTFASTGSKELTGAGVYVGTERIRTALNLRGPKGGRSANFFTIHQLTQPVIHISADGNSANMRARLFQAGGNADGSSGSWIGGIYENTAIKENGEWKFGRQDLFHIFNASYRNGWARLGKAAGQPLAGRAPSPRDSRGGGITQGLGAAASPNKFATELPPDHAIRSKQYMFPEIIEPAFHYRNPVSGRMPGELLP